MPEVKVKLEITSVMTRANDVSVTWHRLHQRMMQLRLTWKDDVSNDVRRRVKVRESTWRCRAVRGRTHRKFYRRVRACGTPDGDRSGVVKQIAWRPTRLYDFCLDRRFKTTDPTKAVVLAAKIELLAAEIHPWNLWRRRGSLERHWRGLLTGEVEAAEITDKDKTAKHKKVRAMALIPC